MKFISSLVLLLFSTSVLASITANEQWLLNNQMGPVARKVQLGSKLKDAGTGATLANGKIFVGNASGVAAAVTPSGDVTMTNAGVTAIGATRVTNAMLAGSIAESKILAQNAEGLHLKRIARVTYDVATDGGTIGAHLLGVSLPAKAVITRSWLYIVTQFSDAGAGTVALSCEDADNIKTATDITGTAAGGFIEGQSTGTAASMVGNIAAACEVTATVAGADQATGKLLAFIEYVVVE